ncbi:MAG: cobalamin-binding protein [Myxococcota bacterium]|nr:cobalamin-binding protein [Myxococcota bacterium]
MDAKLMAFAEHLQARVDWLASPPDSKPTMKRGPTKIVCLTEEPTEILWALGEADRIVGISAYTVRPPEIRKTKPIVSAFINGSVQKIKALKPDLVVGFSDIQSELAAKLIKAHLPVLIFNQRTIAEILEVIGTLGRIVDASAKANALVDQYRRRLDQIATAGRKLSYRPRVYFEEWDDPMISGIQWVSELIEVAGGTDVFSDLAECKGAMERVVTSEQIIAAQPDIILASWCGKPVDIDQIKSRAGFHGIPAVQKQRIYEIDPCIILQPGPAALTDGLDLVSQIIRG